MVPVSLFQIFKAVYILLYCAMDRDSPNPTVISCRELVQSLVTCNMRRGFYDPKGFPHNHRRLLSDLMLVIHFFKSEGDMDPLKF